MSLWQEGRAFATDHIATGRNLSALYLTSSAQAEPIKGCQLFCCKSHLCRNAFYYFLPLLGKQQFSRCRKSLWSVALTATVFFADLIEFCQWIFLMGSIERENVCVCCKRGRKSVWVREREWEEKKQAYQCIDKAQSSSDVWPWTRCCWASRCELELNICSDASRDEKSLGGREIVNKSFERGPAAVNKQALCVLDAEFGVA